MSAVGRLLRNENNIDFAQLWKRTLYVSAVLLVITLLSLVLRGFNLGIEFEGGASWEVRSSDVTSDDLKSALDPLGLGDARIQQVANQLWRVRAEVDSAASLEDVKIALAEVAGIDPADVTANAVGASWGSEVTNKARNALIVFFIVLFVYISLRLEWKMAVAALLAVVHDILITVGIYSLFQLEVTSATVIAFLTILGYSLYDTMVVFDKVRENEGRAAGASGLTYTEVTSYSMNQVLMRSVNASFTSILPVLAVLVVGRFILGAVTLQEFAIALLVGLIVGTYSSLFVATPIVAWLKEREAANVERRLTAAKREGGLDVAEALAVADRARTVRSSARGEGRRITAASPVRTVSVTKRRVAGGERAAADGAKDTKSAPGTGRVDNTDRAPQGEIKPRPRKKKR